VVKEKGVPGHGPNSSSRSIFERRKVGSGLPTCIEKERPIDCSVRERQVCNPYIGERQDEKF
jgi:hypothetical protein